MGGPILQKANRGFLLHVDAGFPEAESSSRRTSQGPGSGHATGSRSKPVPRPGQTQGVRRETPPPCRRNCKTPTMAAGRLTTCLRTWTALHLRVAAEGHILKDAFPTQRFVPNRPRGQSLSTRGGEKEVTREGRRDRKVAGQDECLVGAQQVTWHKVAP